MGFSPYSQIVAPPEHVDPMDLNLLLKGTMYEHEQKQKNFNEIQGQINNVLSIPAYGKDKEILNQKIQELQQAMGGLDVSNLGTPQTKQQVNSLINQFSQDKDVQAVTNRGYTYKSEMDKKEEAESKGKQYYSPIINQANKYYNSGEYYQKKQFNGSGYLLTNIAEEYNKGLKDIPKEKKFTTDAQGKVTQSEEYNQPAFKAFTDNFYDNPAIKRQLSDQIENDSNVDWDTQGKQQLQEHIDANQATIDLNKQLLFSLPQNDVVGRQNAMLKIQQAEQAIPQLQQMQQSDNNGAFAKSMYIQKHLDSKKEEAMRLAKFHSEDYQKYDEVKMENLKTSNEIYKANVESVNKQKEELFKQQAELFEGLTKEEQDLVRKQGNFNGVDLSKAYQTIESNKRKNAEAANPNISKRYENVIDYIREGAVKGGAEEKNVVSITKNNIDYFKKAGFENIKGIDKVTIDENGDYIVDFDRGNIDQLHIPIGIKNNLIGDEVKFTKEEMARIHELGTGKRKLEDLNNFNTKETTSIVGTIPKKDLVKYKTVTTVDPSTLKKGDINLIDGYPYQWNGASYDSLKVTE